MKKLLEAKEKYNKNKTIKTNKPAIILLNSAATKSFLELLKKKDGPEAEFWRGRSFVYIGADEWLFKPKVIEGPLDTVTYTLDGVPLFEGHRRAWRVTKEGATAEATVTSEEIEEEEENQDPGREIPHRVR
ncbi:unnamed protein product [Rotaria socialis]|uniref:Uncharacterized protein n=1 Tax=Rotaria socialis TaxID=392032 RepID=A0A821RB40_9BILA|nr:unnamed protein product [Rotaria socialis]